ncbi:hypothetical protein ES332_D07G001000v1 [Gossypium tomentosum]|uniref:Uncharacterized protein n=1 Tax=Gossypium tomentosum TaxID=34277 RepID=A0A5D2K1Q4_GOSTO|nr:hypothetical protein ES332_D07G001000v1 [Gossypium tomentosum]
MKKNFLLSLLKFLRVSFKWVKKVAIIVELLPFNSCVVCMVYGE